MSAKSWKTICPPDIKPGLDSNREISWKDTHTSGLNSVSLTFISISLSIITLPGNKCDISSVLTFFSGSLLRDKFSLLGLTLVPSSLEEIRWIGCSECRRFIFLLEISRRWHPEQEHLGFKFVAFLICKAEKQMFI